jgi:hypothetical protein
MKGGEFLEWLRDCQTLKKDSAGWNQNSDIRIATTTTINVPNGRSMNTGKTLHWLLLHSLDGNFLKRHLTTLRQLSDIHFNRRVNSVRQANGLERKSFLSSSGLQKIKSALYLTRRLRSVKMEKG